MVAAESSPEQLEILPIPVFNLDRRAWLLCNGYTWSINACMPHVSSLYIVMPDRLVARFWLSSAFRRKCARVHRTSRNGALHR